MPFGIYLEDEYGNPWYWDGTRNFQLIETHSYNGVYADRKYDTGISVSKPCMIFWQVAWAPDENLLPLMTYSSRDGVSWKYEFDIFDAKSIGAFSPVNVRIFIFSNYATFLPHYGIAIMDEREDLVLTNESKLLRIAGTLDPRSLSNKRVIAGNYAIMPMLTNAIYFDSTEDHEGNSFLVKVGTSALLQGSSTVINNDPARGGGEYGWSGSTNLIWDDLFFSPGGMNIVNSPIPYINVAEYI